MYLKDRLKENKSKSGPPADGTVYEYIFNERTKNWTHWDDQNKNFEVDPKLSYAEILIPTTDSTRNMHLMRTLL